MDKMYLRDAVLAAQGESYMRKTHNEPRRFRLRYYDDSRG